MFLFLSLSYVTFYILMVFYNLRNGSYRLFIQRRLTDVIHYNGVFGSFQSREPP